MSEWLSITEKQPKDGQNCLINLVDGIVTTGIYTNFYDSFLNHKFGVDWPLYPTAWMPMPKGKKMTTVDPKYIREQLKVLEKELGVSYADCRNAYYFSGQDIECARELLKDYFIPMSNKGLFI